MNIWKRYSMRVSKNWVKFNKMFTLSPCIGPIEETQILTIAPFTSLGTPLEIIRAFGGKSQYEHAVNELEQALYSA